MLIVLSLPEQGKREEVAVKVVRKDLFRQDPKAEQNLDREIKILKRLKNSEYVVHLYHVQVWWEQLYLQSRKRGGKRDGIKRKASM